MERQLQSRPSNDSAESTGPDATAPSTRGYRRELAEQDRELADKIGHLAAMFNRTDVENRGAQ